MSRPNRPCASPIRPVARAGSLLGAACLALLLAGGAQARQDKAPAVPGIVEQARTLAHADRAEGLALLEEYLAGTPDPAVEPWVALEAGEQRRLLGDLPAARALFQRVRERFPGHSLVEAATLGLCLVDAGENPSGNQAATLRLLLAVGAPPSMDADRYRLLALAHGPDGLDAARADLARAKSLAEASGDALVQGRTARVALPETEPAKAERPSGTAPPVPAPGDDPLGAQALARAWEMLDAGDLQGARAAAEGVQATWPQSPRLVEARAIQRLADAGNRVDTRTVGVLLPLTGLYAAPALRLKQVIEMANLHSGSPMRLVFLDTAGKPEQAVKQLEQLALERGAIAVLGPLLKEDASAAAEAAQAMHLPMVSLSQTEGITSERPFVVRGFLTPVQQVRALVSHAMGPMGLNRFAVLAPDTAFGRLAAEAFAVEVAERGGSTIKKVFYDPTAGDFRKPAAELAAKDYKARAGEFYRLKSQAKERGMDPDKVVLPPQVDYQAIFIPDSAQRVPLVASALAYEEFAIGTFRPRRDDVPLVLLGLNSWNDDQLAISGGKYVRGGVFVDAFDARDEALPIRSFVDACRQTLGSEPTVVDALGYDAARLVALAVASGPGSRDDMRQALHAAQLPDTVSGGLRFGEDGEVQRTLRVLTVGAERIEPWQPAPPEPAIPAAP